jgi:hypothetical protein
MSIFSDPLGTLKHVVSDGVGIAKSTVETVKDGVQDGLKLATDSDYRKQVWDSAVDDAKAAANVAATPFRAADAAKDKLGSVIDSGEQYLDHKVSEGRAWLAQHGGVTGKVASDLIGVDQGIAESIYGAGKGVVQLANGAASLANPIEWAVNPDQNVDCLKTALSTAETLGKLTTPEGWLADPQGNERMVGALWHSAATSFSKDPSKFIGNVVGTIGTLAIPGAGAAGAVANTARATGAVTETADALNAVNDVARAAPLAEDAGNAAALGNDAGRAGGETKALSEAGEARPPAEAETRPAETRPAEAPGPKMLSLKDVEPELKSAARDELARLKAEGVSNKRLGPAISVAIDRNTGEMSQVFLNNAEGDVPARLNPLLEQRLPEARQLDYFKTHGAGSHAEVYAVNQLLNKGAHIDEIAVYTEQIGTARAGTVKPPCPHCDFLRQGVKYVP